MTHYHTDHVGNAAAIAAKIRVGSFIDRGESAETTPDAKALYEGMFSSRRPALQLAITLLIE